MAFTGINANPTIGSAGVKVKLAPLGTSSVVPTDTHHAAVFAYLQSAPSNSKLPTLDQLDALASFLAGDVPIYSGPLALTTTREDIRLRQEGAFVVFTPDAPGRYVVRVFDVTLYRFLPHYGGHVPASGEVAELDNEEAALPGYAGGTAQATSIALSYDVAETRTRTIGVEPETATLSARTFADELDAHAVDHGLTLTAGPGAIAKVAVFAPDVLKVLDVMRQTATVSSYPFFQDFAGVTNADISSAITRWNRHLALSGWSTHGNGTDANTVATADATDLASALTLLVAIKTQYDLHRVNVAGAPAVHQAADTINVVSAAAPTNLVTALAYFNDLWSAFNAHARSNVPHNGGTGPIDGNTNEQLEAPSTLAELVSRTNALKALYNLHHVMTGGAAHASADADNTVIVDFANTEGIIATVNLWAKSIMNHATNLDENGSPAGTAYHQPGGTATQDVSAKIPVLASSLAQAARTAEWCLIAMEEHLRSAVHTTKAAGAHVITFAYSTRLTKQWMRAVGAYTAIVPDGFNAGATTLAIKQGWS